MAAAGNVAFRAVPAEDRWELYRKYKISRESARGNASKRFAWHKKDLRFRCLLVKCSGFAENGGTVYVNRAILATLSAEFEEKIDRDQEIRFDCSAEDFNIALTLVHSTNRVRPTNSKLFMCLPALHACGLDFVGQICHWCMDKSMFSKAELLQAAVKSENALLLESTLLDMESRRELRELTKACGFGPVVCGTSLVARIARAVCRLAGLLYQMVTATQRYPKLLSDALDRHMALEEGQRVAGVATQRHGVARAMDVTFQERCRDQVPDFRISSGLRDFAVTIDGTKLFLSHEVLARASSFFYEYIFGDKAALGWIGQAQHPLDLLLHDKTVDDFKLLLRLVFPTPYGMMWRLIPIRKHLPDPFLLTLFYDSDAGFNHNPLTFVNVFKLAHSFKITGLVHYLTEMAIECLPWRERLHLADTCKSREIMDSLLSDNYCLEKLKREADARGAIWQGLATPTQELINQFLAKATL